MGYLGQYLGRYLGHYLGYSDEEAPEAARVPETVSVALVETAITVELAE